MEATEDQSRSATVVGDGVVPPEAWVVNELVVRKMLRESELENDLEYTLGMRAGETERSFNLGVFGDTVKIEAMSKARGPVIAMALSISGTANTQPRIKAMRLKPLR